MHPLLSGHAASSRRRPMGETEMRPGFVILARVWRAKNPGHPGASHSGVSQPIGGSLSA